MHAWHARTLTWPGHARWHARWHARSPVRPRRCPRRCGARPGQAMPRARAQSWAGQRAPPAGTQHGARNGRVGRRVKRGKERRRGGGLAGYCKPRVVGPRLRASRGPHQGPPGLLGLEDCPDLCGTLAPQRCRRRDGAAGPGVRRGRGGGWILPRHRGAGHCHERALQVGGDELLLLAAPCACVGGWVGRTASR